MIKYPGVGKSLDDQFNPDTVQVAARYTYDWFGCAHSILIPVKIAYSP
jgi:hypothetical protein